MPWYLPWMIGKKSEKNIVLKQPFATDLNSIWLYYVLLMWVMLVIIFSIMIAELCQDALLQGKGWEKLFRIKEKKSLEMSASEVFVLIKPLSCHHRLFKVAERSCWFVNGLSYQYLPTCNCMKNVDCMKLGYLVLIHTGMDNCVNRRTQNPTGALVCLAWVCTHRKEVSAKCLVAMDRLVKYRWCTIGR